MMQAFRSSAKVIAAIFALLMLIFVLTSVDWRALGSARNVGKINGEAVDARTYETVVQQQIDARQRQSAGSLGMEDLQAIRNDVWEQFVQTAVLEDEYRERGITATDDEVVDAMRHSPLPEFQQAPEFQTDSQFDRGKYQRWLTSSVAQQYLPALEAQYREQIKRAKLFREVTTDVYLSDPELWQRYRDENETVKIALAAIVPRNAVPDSAVTLTPQEVEAYYKSHQAELKRPKTAHLSYLALSRITTASDTAAARARADSVRQEIAGGAPFADVARRESSDTVSAARGGELGEWTRGAMDPAFDSAAFSLPLNQVSEPVLSQFGFHVIQVISRKGDKANARHILIPIELAGAHRDQLDAQADSLEQLAAEQLDPAALDTAASALKLRIARTQPVQEGTRVQAGRLVVPDAGIWAFQAKEGETSPIIETSYAYYVFRVDSITPAGVPPLANIRASVEQAARNEKKREAARAIGKDLLERMDGGSTIAQAATALKLPNNEFGPFTRVNPPLANPMVVGTAFGLDQGKRSGLIETDEGLYVIQVLDHTRPDSAAFAKAINEYRSQAVRLARQDRIRNFLAALRSSAKIVDQRDQVQQTSAQAAQQAS